MKLNPKKCTFSAEEGAFIGYVVSTQGIKACPEKVEAVVKLHSPRTLKEAQSLNGKLSSLNRFLSKSAEKSLPFFKTLKRCIKKRFPVDIRSGKSVLKYEEVYSGTANDKLQSDGKSGFGISIRYKKAEKIFPSTPDSGSRIPAHKTDPVIARIIMPPRILKKKSIKRLVEKHVAKAIEEYEKSRANLDSVGSSGGNPGNAEGSMNVHGCSHKDFMNENHTLLMNVGLVNANHIPWTEFKTMMTTKYCPTIEIQRMEQELWTLTLKGDDIEAYNNRFHKLALMCPELVPMKKRRLNRYTRGFPKESKENITSF
ncbi:putative reverse transcriptase domain-containing protein [Tanacetum coccineum]